MTDGKHTGSRRVLVIGLDMGDGSLIRYWSQQGRLPHFASLLATYGTPYSQPAALLKELQAGFGKYPLGFEAKRLGAHLPAAALIESRLVRSVDYKRATIQWLLKNKPWELAVVSFGANRIQPAITSGQRQLTAWSRETTKTSSRSGVSTPPSIRPWGPSCRTCQATWRCWW
jgi:hypothetical protein